MSSRARAGASRHALRVKGIIEYNCGYHYDHNGRTAPQSKQRYVLPMFVPGSAEQFNVDHERQKRKATRSTPRFPAPSALQSALAYLARITYMPSAGKMRLPPGGAGIGMHVIPVEKAIETREPVRGHRAHLALAQEVRGPLRGAAPCSCRAEPRRTCDEGCAGRPDRTWCIGVGDMADYLVRDRQGPLHHL